MGASQLGLGLLLAKCCLVLTALLHLLTSALA
jgi:hypothetical protein